MSFCGRCGAALSSDMSYCAKCGASVVTGAGKAPEQIGSSMSSNVAGALAYLLGFITGIVFLLWEPYKNDRFVRFHAFQSIFFSIAVLVWVYATNIVFWMLFSVIGIMGTLFGLLSSLVSLALFLFWLFLMYKAYSREQFRIPLIGDLAAKQAQ